MSLEGRSILPDALRGGASLVVAFAHAWQVFLLPYTGQSFGMRLAGGLATWSVSVFFLLSGLLIGNSIARQVRSGRFSLSHYAQDRALRIYPPLIFSVVLTIGCVLIIQWFDLYGADSYVLPGDLGQARKSAVLEWWAVLPTLTTTYQVIPSFNYLTFNGPLWSLSFEVWLYALAGLLTFAVLTGEGWIAVAIVAAMMFVFSSAKYPPVWAVSAVWAMGFAYSTVSKRAKDVFVAGKWLLAIVAGAFCLLLANVDLFQFWVSPYIGFRQHLFYVLFSAIVFCGMTALLARDDLEEHPVCKFLAWNADFSYTLYLIHFPLFLLCLSFFRPSLVNWGLAGMVPLAALSFIFAVLMSWAVAMVVEDRAMMKRLVMTIIGRFRAKPV